MKRKIIIALIVSLISINLFSLKVPKLESRITDNANILSRNEESQLEKYLYEVEQKTSSQIALLTIKSLEGESIEAYSIEVAEKWKLGQKDLDNGVLLLVSTGDRKLRIEVGYGLEGILTDLKSSYIVRNIIVPEFKRGDFKTGIVKGLASISGVITNEFDISPEELAKYQKTKDQPKKSGTPLSFLFFIIIFLFIGLRGGPLGLLFMIFFGSSMGRGSSGGYGGGSGFGGGGFSGGGGSFGGGGSSGGW